MINHDRLSCGAQKPPLTNRLEFTCDMKPQHHPLAGQFHALAALLELLLNKRKKQAAQNTVECDGVTLQCYNQSPEKSNTIKRKKNFFSRLMALAYLNGTSMVWCIPIGDEQAGVTQVECLPSPYLHIAFSAKKDP